LNTLCLEIENVAPVPDTGCICNDDLEKIEWVAHIGRPEDLILEGVADDTLENIAAIIVDSGKLAQQVMWKAESSLRYTVRARASRPRERHILARGDVADHKARSQR
jgi:hypothetical protein